MSLAERLALVDAGDDTFTNRDPIEGPHVFGGLLVAHALRAATRTVPAERGAHSLHASFVQAARGGEDVRYEVERTRDGSSFAARRVVARQGRGPVLVLTAGFHEDEPGVEHEVPAPVGEGSGQGEAQALRAAGDHGDGVVSVV